MAKTLKQILEAQTSKLGVQTTLPKDDDLIWKTELTADELFQAIYAAKRTKHFAELEQQKNALKLKKHTEAMQPWDYKEQMLNAVAKAKVLASNSGKTFTMDKGASPVYDALTLYFTNDQKFEKLEDGYKLNKGIFIMGDPGVGKTDALLSFQINKRQPYMLISCEEIEGVVKLKGTNYLIQYIDFVAGHGMTVDTFYKEVSWCFDDLGRESQLVDFGAKCDCLPRLLHTIYTLRKKGTGVVLPHLSTNYNFDQLEERYDYTVVSRLKEMYNVIIMQGNDRREA